jgi:SpoVK/Ycf46/Vps4 family AAA+-type ATPase
LVNLLLLELDRWPSTSLLIAATNYPDLLDRALWRRFDSVIEFPLPDEGMRMRIIEECLGRHGRVVDPHSVSLAARLTRNASGSDLALCVRSAVKEAVLGNIPLDGALRRSATMSLVRSAARGDEVSRTLFCRIAHSDLGLTHREIAAMLGVSHVTVGNIIKNRSAAEGTTKRARRIPTAPSSKGQ